jgi:Colicin V production protein.
VTDVLANIISFALIFAAAMLVLSIITWILDLIFKLPVLKAANTLLGLIFGVVCALVLAWLMGMVSIYLIGAMSSIYPELFNSTVVQNSVILKFISENNILTFLPASDFLT